MPSSAERPTRRKQKKCHLGELSSSLESLPSEDVINPLPNTVFISVDPGARNCWGVVMESIPVAGYPGKYVFQRAEMCQRLKFLDFPNVVDSLKESYGQALDGFLAQEAERDMKLLMERDSFILTENIKKGNVMLGLVIEKQGEYPYYAIQHHILHAFVNYCVTHSLPFFTRTVSPISVSIYYNLSKLSNYNRDRKKELTVQAVNKVLWNADLNPHCADGVLNLFYINELRDTAGELLKNAILGDRHDDPSLSTRGGRKPKGNLRAKTKKSRNSRPPPGPGSFL
jgi:hypothetical protein